jgi:hypothetical protein
VIVPKFRDESSTMKFAHRADALVGAADTNAGVISTRESLTVISCASGCGGACVIRNSIPKMSASLEREAVDQAGLHRADLDAVVTDVLAVAVDDLEVVASSRTADVIGGLIQ